MPSDTIYKHNTFGDIYKETLVYKVKRNVLDVI